MANSSCKIRATCGVNRRNIVRKGRGFFNGYKILNKDFDRRNLSETIQLIEWCSRNMKTPRMMHHVLAIEEDTSVFETNRFIQRFKEKFARFIRERNRNRNKESKDKRVKIPDIHLFFSIESKYLNPLNPVPYLHLHLMTIIDTNHNDYGYKELNICINKALSKIHGLESLWFDQDKAIFLKDNRPLNHGFLKYRNENSSIKIGSFNELHWHNLKTELEDAVCRASYLCKLDQKNLLPEKFKRGNSFGHTRPTKAIKQESKKIKNIPIGTQLDFF